MVDAGMNINWSKKAWFICMAALFVFIQMQLVARPIQHRTLPVEVDDSLVYIWKAAQMNDCFFQDCAALKGIQEQFDSLKADGNYDLRNLRQERMFFHVYHPVHSLLMVWFQSADMSWEQAFNLFRLIASFFALLGIVFFVSVVFKDAVGGLLLLLLSTTLFPEQGLHMMAPSNLSVAIGFFLVAAIIRWGRRASWLIFLSTFMLVGFHQVYSFVCAVSCLLYFIIWRKNIEIVDKILLGLSMLFCAGYQLVQFFVKKPLFSIDKPGYLEEETDFLNEIVRNYEYAVVLTDKWFEYSMAGFYPTASIIFILAGFAVAFVKGHREIFYGAGFVIAISFASLFYVYPLKPGLLFQRIMMFGGVYLSGLTCYGVFYVSKFILNLDLRNSLRIIVLIPLLYGCFTTFRVLVPKFSNELSARIDRHNISLEPQQVEALLRHATNDSRVLYRKNNFMGGMNEVSALFFLSYGAANFRSKVDGIESDVFDPANFDFIVDWNPLMQFYFAPTEEFLVPDHGVSLFYMGEETDGQLVIRSPEFMAHDGANNTVVRYVDSGGVVESVSAGDSIKIGLGDLAGQVVHVTFARGTKISGISIEPEQKTRWPWGERLKIFFDPPDVVFDSNTTNKFIDFSLEGYGHQGYTVIDDSGYSLLLKNENSFHDSSKL